MSLGVQFGTLNTFKTVHAGMLWDVYRKRYPKYQEQAPLPTTFETFGSTQGDVGAVQLQFMTQPPLPRIWFLNATETELIQFQQDRFVHNWRKVGEGEKYPRYEKIRGKFIKDLGKLRRFLKAQNLGQIDPNQCEVTYVNHISSGDGEDLLSDLGSLLSG